MESCALSNRVAIDIFHVGFQKSLAKEKEIMNKLKIKADTNAYEMPSTCNAGSKIRWILWKKTKE
jgi:hypothetical protein